MQTNLTARHVATPIVLKCELNAQLSGKLTAEEVAAIARARAKREREIDAEECKAGRAAGRMRFKLGVVGTYPPKKRQATSGCGPRRRREHRGMVRIPQ